MLRASASRRRCTTLSIANRRAILGTLRRECLDLILVLGRCHLQVVLTEDVGHYNSHRPHRSLSQRAPSKSNTAPAFMRDIDPTKLRRTGQRMGSRYQQGRRGRVSTSHAMAQVRLLTSIRIRLVVLTPLPCSL